MVMRVVSLCVLALLFAEAARADLSFSDPDSKQITTKLGEDVSISIDGFFRLRSQNYYFTGSNLYEQAEWGDYRGKLILGLELGERVAIYTSFDALDNFVAGFNGPTGNILSQTPTNTASSPSFIFNETFEDETIKVTELYAQVWSDFGIFQVGRLPLEWGLGIVYNNARSLDSDYSIRQDRIFYQHEVYSFEFDRYEFPVVIAASYGMLSEGDTTLKDDDTEEYMVQGLIQNELTTLGLMLVNRHSRNLRGPVASDTGFRVDNQDIWIISTHFGFWGGPMRFDIEYSAFAGEMDMAESFSFGEATPSSQVTGADEISVNGFNLVARAVTEVPNFRNTLEYGYSSGGNETGLRFSQTGGGDELGTLVGSTFNTYAFNPNYRVDLIMFREMLAGVTAATVLPYDDTFGSIGNAQYIKYKDELIFDVADDATFTFEYSALWAQLNDTNIYKTFSPAQSIKPQLGWEFNVGLWYRKEMNYDNLYLGRLHAGLLGGYFIAGDFFDSLEVFNGRVISDDPNPGLSLFEDDDAWTIQGHIIYEF